MIILALGQGLKDYVNDVYTSNLQSTQITVRKDDNDDFSETQIETIDDMSLM